MGDTPKAIEPYGQEWIDAKFNELSPQVEAIVRQSFSHARGARFGAAGATLARRLAALKTEIATEAAAQKAKIEETKRQETVAEQNRIAANQRSVAEKSREENVARESDRTKMDWYDRRNNESLDLARQNADETKRWEVYKELHRYPKEELQKIHMSPEIQAFLSEGQTGMGENKFPREGGRPGGGFNAYLPGGPSSPTTMRSGSMYTTPEAYDRSPGGGGGSGFNQYSIPTSYTPPSHSDPGERAPGHGTPYSPGMMSGLNYEDLPNRNRWSGNINSNTPNEFTKTLRQMSGFWRNFA